MNLDKYGAIFGTDPSILHPQKLQFLWQQYKNDGRIGPLLQSLCDELVSALEQISQAPEPSKLFQAMLDMAVAHALDLTTQRRQITELDLCQFIDTG